MPEDFERPPQHPEVDRNKEGFPEFSVSWQPGLEKDSVIEELAQELLREGIDYLRATAGDDYPVSPSYQVRLSRRQRHAAGGALIDVSAARLKDLSNFAEPAARDLEQSLIIHELVHNLQDEEGLPMLIELTYELEKGHVDRLRQLADLLRDGKLSSPYTAGLDRIAAWLGHETSEDFLRRADNSSVEPMKKVFRMEVNRIREELDQEVAQGLSTSTNDLKNIL